MSGSGPGEGGDASRAVTLPARVAVRCGECGYERGMLVIHDDALRRARICERCGGAADVVSASTAHGFGCPCCL